VKIQPTNGRVRYLPCNTPRSAQTSAVRSNKHPERIKIGILALVAQLTEVRPTLVLVVGVGDPVAQQGKVITISHLGVWAMYDHAKSAELS
jgi:hypothetical protein